MSNFFSLVKCASFCWKIVLPLLSFVLKSWWLNSVIYYFCSFILGNSTHPKTFPLFKFKCVFDKMSKFIRKNLQKYGNVTFLLKTLKSFLSKRVKRLINWKCKFRSESKAIKSDLDLSITEGLKQIENAKICDAIDWEQFVISQLENCHG